MWRYPPPGPAGTGASASGWYAPAMPGKNAVPVTSSACRCPPRPARDTAASPLLRAESPVLSVTSGPVTSRPLSDLSEAAPRIPADSSERQQCLPSLVSLPCFVFPYLTVCPGAFAGRFSHRSVPLLICQASAGSLSSNARRKAFGKPLPATTSAVSTDTTEISRTLRRANPV
ncbi:Uncharacterised protein [Klebsiella pneumoniae]|nr:Uncharacterised protein [Klebsiella pneumoniae]